MFNPIVQGWINYYGRYYPSMLRLTLRPLNEYLVRWARRKYKRLRGHEARARDFVATVGRREPHLFAHWRIGVRPDGWVTGAGELRGSRRVLRAPGGETPPGDSPHRGLPAQGGRRPV